MLLGERLGRRHQRPLQPVLDRAEQRVKSDDRLAGADVALEEPLHRCRAREVGVDLRDRAPLVRRELEGQHVEVARGELARRAERRRPLRLALACAPREPELEHEQLVEGQPRAGPLGLVEGLRAMQRVQGVRLQRQRAPGLEIGGQRVGEVVHRLEGGADQLAELLGRDVLARVVDGHERLRAGDGGELVGADGERPAPERPDQPDTRPGLQLLGDPGLVEPHGADRVRLVHDGGLDDRQADLPLAERLGKQAIVVPA